MTTLLEKAKGIVVYHPTPSEPSFTEEDLELTLAWLKGQITTSQIAKAMPGPYKSPTSYTLNVLKWAFACGYDVKK